MDSNKRIMKTKIKLYEDIEYYSNESLKKEHKNQFFEQIIETIEEIAENNQKIQTIDPKEDQNKEIDENNKFFDSETQLIIDETHLKYRETLYRSDSEITESDHYFRLITGLNGQYLSLRHKLNLLTNELLLYKHRKRTEDSQYISTLKGEKRSNWCRLCYRRANVRIHCCRLGYYCSFTHNKGDRSHFGYCKQRNP